MLSLRLAGPAVISAQMLYHTPMPPQEAMVLPNDGGPMLIPGGGGTPASSGAGSMLPPPARFPAGRTPGGGHWTGPSWPAARSVGGGGGGHSLGSPSLFGRSVDMVDLAVQMMGDGGARPCWFHCMHADAPKCLIRQQHRISIPPQKPSWLLGPQAARQSRAPAPPPMCKSCHGVSGGNLTAE